MLKLFLKFVDHNLYFIKLSFLYFASRKQYKNLLAMPYSNKQLIEKVKLVLD